MLIYLQVIETEEDKSKFEDIYLEYRGLMYYVAYKRLHHEQDAEDAVHHAFMKIESYLRSYSEKSFLYSLCYGKTPTIQPSPVMLQ